MTHTRTRIRRGVLIALGSCLLSCSGPPPPELGAGSPRLAPCPASPNCVSSDAGDDRHAIRPFEIVGPAARAWETARAVVADRPRTTIVSDSPGYLRAECRSLLFRFVDDLELELRESQGIIAVRSASRTGYGDMGVNRRRVEAIRAELARRGATR
jgi:uncharacterized protein (DUF1499 family)